MKGVTKPVRKCHGCGLNLGRRCAVHPEPRAMWHHRTCPGFGNEEMRLRFEAEQSKHLPDYSKERRRDAARRRDSEPHWQGTLPYSRR
jgi:hypothetical protein